MSLLPTLVHSNSDQKETLLFYCLPAVWDNFLGHFGQ